MGEYFVKPRRERKVLTTLEMKPITSFEEFRHEFMMAISYSLQFGRIPQALYPRMNPDGTINSYYPYARIQRVLDMAQKKPAKKRTPFGNIEFVNFKFNKEQKAQFEAWFATKGNTVLQAVFETLQGEHKMSVSYDADNECFIGSMTGKEDSLNKDLCLTIRSAEWFRAMAACAYVHTVIFSGESWEVEVTTDLV